MSEDPRKYFTEEEADRWLGPIVREAVSGGLGCGWVQGQAARILMLGVEGPVLGLEDVRALAASAVTVGMLLEAKMHSQEKKP